MANLKNIKMNFSASLLALFFLTSVAGQNSKQVESPKDTLKFGQFYIENGEANIPLLQVVDLKTNKSIIALKSNKWHKIKLTTGLFDKYISHASIQSENGQIKKTNKRYVYRIKAQKSNIKLLELKVEYNLEGDTIIYITREHKTLDDTIKEKSR